MTYEQYAGYLGHFGLSLNSEYNEKLAEANKVIDEYNQNVATIEGSDNQMAYQREMWAKAHQILGVERKEYVVLEHLCLPDKGRRFWTRNTNNNTHSIKGELWYKEIIFTDSKEEAIEESRHINLEATPTYNELVDYYKTHKE